MAGDQVSVLDMIDSMRKRLKRRNMLLDDVRTAYLKDVVVVRELLSRQSPAADKMTASLNLRPTLALYAPSECTFRIAHGEGLDHYGGHLEVVHHESKRVVELSKRIEELLEAEQDSRFKAAKLDLRAQQDRLALISQRVSSRDEREQLCNEVQVLKDRLGRVDETAHETLQRTVYGLQRQLEQAEARIRELLPLVGDSARNQQDAGQAELQLAGKDHRIADLEKQLSTSKYDLGCELKRYSDIEIKYDDECAKSRLLQRQCDDIETVLTTTKKQCGAIQGSLDESRRAQAELQQKLSDLRVEYTEAVQREEAEQEELQLHLEQARTQERKARAETDEFNTKLINSELAQQEALAKACADLETQLGAKHSHTDKQLRDEIMRYEEKSSKLEAKLKIEQEKRASLEVELHSSQVETEEHKSAASSSKNEVSTQVAEILSLLQTCPQNLDPEPEPDTSELEIVRSRVANLLSILIKTTEEKTALELHLQQYKTKTGAVTSSAKLMSVISTRDSSDSVSQDQLVQMLQENADGMSQLQTELDYITSEKERAEADSKLLAEALNKSQADLDALHGQNVRTREAQSAAQASLHEELLGELERARSCAWPESAVQAADDLKSKVRSLEEKLASLHQDARAFLLTRKTGTASAPALQADHLEGGAREFSGGGSGSNFEDDESKSQLKSATSLLGDLLQQVHAFKPSSETSTNEEQDLNIEVPAQSDVDEFNVVFTNLASQFTSALQAVSVELLEARAVISTLPDGFSYKEMAEKLSVLEQASRETGEGDQGKRSGREEELQRLKQRNASQQNFIMELQEEVATMKGLMFAADEIKRQYSELEDKYRLLENEFTEKAENEVNSRKAKERIELQLTLAHADVASLSRDKGTLTDALKANEDAITKLESKLAHALKVYEDVVQRERSRLETNRDIQTQFNPTLLDIAIQTSFKTPAMTLRQINSYSHVPHRRRGPGLVTPAPSSNEISIPEHSIANSGVFQDKGTMWSNSVT